MYEPPGGPSLGLCFIHWGFHFLFFSPTTYLLGKLPGDPVFIRFSSRERYSVFLVRLIYNHMCGPFWFLLCHWHAESTLSVGKNKPLIDFNQDIWWYLVPLFTSSKKRKSTLETFLGEALLVFHIWKITKSRSRDSVRYPGEDTSYNHLQGPRKRI